MDSLAVFEVNQLQFGGDCADKNLALDSQQQPIVVIRNPNGGAFKFPVWLELVLFTHAFQLQIELDRIVTSRSHAHVFAADNSKSGDVGGIRRINCNAINTTIA